MTRNTTFHSAKNCQLEKLFGISIDIHPDGKTLVLTNFLKEALPIYTQRVKRGYNLIKINEYDVNSSNINMVLHKVTEAPYNPKLTFQIVQKTLEFDIEKLLLTKEGVDNTLIQLIKDSFCSIIYISCEDIENGASDDRGVLYCYPRPYNQNFLYNTRGAYITLNHLAPKSLKTSEPICSTVLHCYNIINISYKSNDNDLLLLALPNGKVDRFVSERVLNEIVRLLEFLYGSLKTCFTKQNNIDKLDGLFTRIFVTILNNSGKLNETKCAGMFEETLGAHAMTLPVEVKIQIDDSLTELEAADYREWV